MITKFDNVIVQKRAKDNWIFCSDEGHHSNVLTFVFFR